MKQIFNDPCKQMLRPLRSHPADGTGSLKSQIYCRMAGVNHGKTSAGGGVINTSALINSCSLSLLSCLRESDQIVKMGRQSSRTPFSSYKHTDSTLYKVVVDQADGSLHSIHANHTLSP